MAAGLAVCTMAARICSTVHFGCACLVSAATPATCGQAIEVPESASGAKPVPDEVDTVATPGAVMLGLRKSSPWRGPPELKLAIFLNPAVLAYPVVFVLRMLVAAMTAALSALATP